MVHPPSPKPEMYVDIGVYGVPKTSDFYPKETTRKLEQYVRSVLGFQMLYADTYMTKDEFREMFDHALHDKLRGQWDKRAAFPEVYDKVCRAARD